MARDDAGAMGGGARDKRPARNNVTASELIELEQVGDDCFRSCHSQDNYRGTIYGGQPLAQALAAAQRTVPQWPAHNCTAYFLRAGSLSEPVEYRVERVRDGRRFAARRVLAWQDGKPIFDMLCSFHDPEPGFAHGSQLTEDVPPPEELISLADFARANADRLPESLVALYTRGFPIELILLDPEEAIFGAPRHAPRSFWFRLPSAEAVPDGREHQCILAFLSDYWLAATATMPHRSPTSARDVMIASLNHSMWFHAPLRADGWLLYRTDSPWAGEGRGLARGLIYDRNGRLVASVVQEASMRLL